MLCATVSRRTCSSAVPILESSRRFSKQRQTARQQPIEAWIIYPFHPRCGERVLVQRRFAYRGVDLVVIPQPDGSTACIPEWMTHERAARFKLAAVPQFSLENLIMLRIEIDALLACLPSDSKREPDGYEAKQQKSRKAAAGTVRSGRAGRGPAADPESPAIEADRSPVHRDRRGSCNRGGRR